ncbi:MAG: single-stranded DNA-binding protein [Synergistaceae bacterium]|jgi:single-strand DNA-binding protein|nr:single-stranded DNA-binding protein [Synergistaceae bacterium]
MSRGFNKVVLMGNLARDPEFRYTVDKRAWARFTVAVGFAWKNKNGEYQEGTDFIPITAWGPLAERCGRYLKKGSSVLVEGKIKVRSYEARDGSGKKYATDVAADNVQFVGSKQSSEGEEFSGAVPGVPASSSRPAVSNDADFGKSVREKGFGDGDFPMDFSEMGENGEGEPEAEIPF